MKISDLYDFDDDRSPPRATLPVRCLDAELLPDAPLLAQQSRKRERVEEAIGELLRRTEWLRRDLVAVISRRERTNYQTVQAIIRAMVERGEVELRVERRASPGHNKGHKLIYVRRKAP